MTKAIDRLHHRASIYMVEPFDYATLGDPGLETRAREAAVAIRDLQRGAVLDVGRALLAMKEALPHGKFDEWVRAEFNWSKSTALNFMRVAERFADNYATVAYLPPAVIYQLASPSTPDVVREAVTQVKDGTQIDAESVKRMIKDVRHSDLKKETRAKHEEREAEEERKTGLKREQRWEAERAKQREEMKAAEAKAEEVADRLKFMLGSYYPEFRELIKTVHRDRFYDALTHLLRQDEYKERHA